MTHTNKKQTNTVVINPIKIDTYCCFFKVDKIFEIDSLGLKIYDLL